MNRRGLLVALLLLVVLGVYAALTLRRDATEQRENLQAGDLVLTARLAAMDRCTVWREGVPRAVFRRGESGWELEEGPEGARPSVVPDLFYSWSLVRFERVIEEDPEDLAPYGLSPPALHVELSGGSGSATLEIGMASKIISEPGLYARIDGEGPVVLLQLSADGLMEEAGRALGLISAAEEAG